MMTDRMLTCVMMTDRMLTCVMMTDRMLTCVMMTDRMLTCVMMTDRMLTCVMMTDRITQFVSLMRLLNFFLSAFLTHKLCSQLYFSLQVKKSKHDDTCVQGHYLQLVVSLIIIQGRFHILLRYDGNIQLPKRRAVLIQRRRCVCFRAGRYRGFVETEGLFVL